MMRAHKCRAKDCTLIVPGHILMCRRHWFMVPAPVRAIVLAEWSKVQSGDMKLTNEYLMAVWGAQLHVLAREGKITMAEVQKRVIDMRDRLIQGEKVDRDELVD